MPTIIFKHPGHKTGTDQRVHRPKSASRAPYAWVGAASRPYWAPGSTKKKPGRKGAAAASPAPAPAPAMRSSGTGPTRGSAVKSPAKPYRNPTTGGTRTTAEMLAGAKFTKPDGRKVKPNMLTVPKGGWNADLSPKQLLSFIDDAASASPKRAKPAAPSGGPGSSYKKNGVPMYVAPRPAAPAASGGSRYVKNGVPMTAYPRPAASAGSSYKKNGVSMYVPPAAPQGTSYKKNGVSMYVPPKKKVVMKFYGFADRVDG